MKVGLGATWGMNGSENAQVHTKALIDILTQCDVKDAKPAGGGTLDDPYRKLSMENWRWAAKENARNEPIIYSVGGRTLVRWGALMGGLKDYISDMTEYPDLLKEILGASKDTVKQKGGEVRGKFEDADKLRGIDTALAAYTKKALRVDNLTDEAAASRSRSLLNDSDTDCTDCPEIASSFCSLFVPEANRAPKTFVISLMLLDAVETGTTYGVEGKKVYSWKSMLMHSKDETVELDVPTRAKGVKLLAKHPMAGLNTVKLGKDMMNWGTDNAVRDRVVSLMSLWLAHYLQKVDSQKTYYLLRSGKDDKAEDIKSFRKTKSDADLLKMCKAAIELRCNTYACLIGGTSIGYRDLQGKSA